MPKLNSDGINAAKLRCARRDGLRCNNPACHKVLGEAYLDSHNQEKNVYLELDHIDGNPENNPEDGSNHQLLCVPCNRLKSAKDKPRAPKFQSHVEFKKLRKIRMRKYGSVRNERLLQQYVSMAKNLNAEPIAIKFFEETVIKYVTIGRDDLVNAAANEVELKTAQTIGQTAVRGYLDKKTNPINGIYEEYQDAEGNWCIRKRRDQ
jgi:hypothetical protein